MIYLVYLYIHLISENTNNIIKYYNDIQPELVFSENFNGTELNIDKRDTCYFWSKDGCTLAGNKEKEWYLKKNLTLRNGNIYLTAKNENIEGYKYTSGMIISKENINFGYGYYEIRAKLPAGKGLWSAIWLISHKHENWGKGADEIDIIEHLGKDRNYTNNNFFTGFESKSSNLKNTDFGKDLTTDFHTYSLLRTKDQIKMYIDGIQTYNYNGITPSDPMHLVINLALGGNWAGEVDSNNLPKNLIVNYIKYYRLFY